MENTVNQTFKKSGISFVWITALCPGPRTVTDKGDSQ